MSAERFPPFDYAQGAPSNVEGRLAEPEAERRARPANYKGPAEAGHYVLPATQ